MKAQIQITADELKELSMFYSKQAARWTICNTIVVQKFGEKNIQFAATDGVKLYVIRRPLTETEQMDVDQFVVPINNVPNKGKYLQYWMTLADTENEVSFNDGENVYRIPTYQEKYPDIQKLMQPLYDAPYANKFAMFKWENIKALDKVLSVYDCPRNSGHVYMWSNLNAEKQKFVIICGIHLDKGDENER